MIDRWRQPWNPGNAVLTVNMEKDKRYAIKIEWIPDGGESYLSAKCLTPIPEDERTITLFYLKLVSNLTIILFTEKIWMM